MTFTKKCLARTTGAGLVCSDNMIEFANKPLTRMPSRSELGGVLWLLAVPVLLGVVLGANQLRAGAFLPWGLSIVYWTTLSLAAWATLAATTALLTRLLAPWNASAWVSWSCGAVLGSLMARPLLYMIAQIFQPYMQNETLRAMPSASLSWDFLAYFTANWGVIILLWIGACWVRKYVSALVAGSEVARDKTQKTSSMKRESAQPEFLRRAELTDTNLIIALKAEDHYTRIITSQGEKLVLERFGEAVEQLDGACLFGMRTHRSWWVAGSQIKAMVVSGANHSVELSNGLLVPVSRTYLENVRNIVNKNESQRVNP